MPRYLLALLAIFVLLCFPARANYSTGDRSASTSQSQRLTLIILPALNLEILGHSQERETGAIRHTWLIGLRANTDWALNYSATSSLQDLPICSSSQETGRSNRDDAYQTLTVTCWQPVSWSDPEGPSEVRLDISASQTLP